MEKRIFIDNVNKYQYNKSVKRKELKLWQIQI